MRIASFSIIAALLLAACAADEVAPGLNDSGFDIRLSDDVSVISRATPAEIGAPVAQDFNLRVVDATTGVAIYDGAFKNHVAARGGDYTLFATYGDDQILAIDKPYYLGAANASITDKTPNPAVDIKCKVANALVSVRYLDKEGKEATTRFDDFFDSYALRVFVGEYSADLKSMSQSAYMRAGSPFRLAFVGTLAGTPNEVSFDIESEDIPSTLEAAQQLIVRLSLQVTPAGLALDVEKAEVKDVTVSETIPLEWIAAPKLAFDGTEVIRRYEDEEAPTNCIYRFTTSHELQDMEIVADFADKRFAAYNGTFLLSQLTPEMRAAFAAAGVTLPEIGKQYKDFAMDLNNFVKGLQTNDGAITNNTIGFRVKANNRWSSEKAHTISVEVKRLRLRLPKQAEGNAWTKTLYINPITASDITAGEGVVVSDVLNSLLYEVSSDQGKTWVKLNPTKESGKLKVSLLSGVTYQIRAVYPTTTLRSDTVSQTLERELDVPNGDFEEMRTTYLNVTIDAGGSYSIWPVTYQNTASFSIDEPKGWATVNAKTCNMDAPGKHNTWYLAPSGYNTGMWWQALQGFGGTKEQWPNPYKNLKAQNGANGMIIRNVGWDHEGANIETSGGAFNTKYFGENIPEVPNRSSGKLFLGEYDYNGGDEIYNEGAEFLSRPTRLSGYYMYELVGDDTEYGTVTVTLLNGDITLGKGTAKLNASSEYIQFNVPITYTNTSLHPTSLRIMFTSSRYASYKQSEENEKVQARTFNNQRESLRRGGTLTVDNLTFTYAK